MNDKNRFFIATSNSSRAFILSGEMVAKAEKVGGEGAAEAAVDGRRRRSFNKPSWLLCNIADLDERIKLLTRKKSPKGNSSDTFSARANSYYHERPQLLELLHDLYNGYLSLADRYCQAFSKNQQNHSPRCSSPITISKFEEDEGEVVDSDAESLMSFQLPMAKHKGADVDMVVADLVMKTVECDIVLDEVVAVEKRWAESSRKIELQKNLVDVLESERLILLNDNATLGYRAGALAEENKGLASESLFLKRKAAELARCVLKTREDHRVFVLSRKIDDLQGQIYGLEKRNKEYYEQLIEQGKKKKKKKKSVLCCNKVMKGMVRERGDLEDCFRAGGALGKCFSFRAKKVGDGKVSKWWDKVKKLDLCATTTT